MKLSYQTVSRFLGGLFHDINALKIPPEFKERYDTEIFKANLQSAKVLSLLVAFLVPLFYLSGLDYLMNPGQTQRILLIRCLTSLGGFAVLYLASRKMFELLGGWLSWLAMFVAAVGVGFIVHIVGYDSPYYAGLNLVYLGSMLVAWNFSTTLLSCLSIYSIYIIPILLFHLDGLNLVAFINNTQFQIFTIVIVSVLNHFQTIRRKREIISRLTIAKQAKELQEIDRYKREFIANITHELKTPLAIVMGNADIVMEQTTDGKLLKMIELIRKAALQLANHVDRIIAVSLADDPDAKPDLGNYDYCGIVQSVFSMFETRAKEEGKTYGLNLCKGPLVVNADIVRIEEVLNNLIQNAFKYTPASGGITVTVSTDGEKVYTEVADTGVGIAAEKIDKVFDRMYQADDVLSKRHGGIGLGLYICKKNVELHGGTISVHSIQGKGTTFKFSLPLHIDQSAPVKNAPYCGEERRSVSRRSGAERRSGADRRMEERRKKFEYRQQLGLDDLAAMTYTGDLGEYEDGNPSRPTILLVEDNRGMMKVITEALNADYNLLLAFDAFEALRKLEANADRIWLILTDIMMPGMSGYEFCERIMTRDEFSHIPLIFISALMDQKDQVRGYELGAADYIIKPYNIKILREKVEHWISRRQYELLLKQTSASLEERAERLAKVRDIILHEIRNPLQIITGAGYFVEKLRETNAPQASEKERRLWENVKLLQQGIDALVSVLETTRQLDIGGLSLRTTEMVGDVVGDAVEKTRHLLGGIRLEWKPGQCGGQRIRCEKKMLVQVLVNLIRNGVEAVREKGGGHEGVIRISAETSVNKMLLKISDNGIGMDTQVVEQLFRFKFTTKKDGTGIGLHLSKMIVKLHEGSISVESQKGKGTTFTLTLPLAPQEEMVCAS